MSNQNPAPSGQVDANLVIQALREEVGDLTMKFATMKAYAQQLEQSIAEAASEVAPASE